MRRSFHIVQTWASVTAATIALGLSVGCTSVSQVATPQTPVSAPALIQRDDGVIEHEASGMRFPPRVADFVRSAPRQYDEKGLDVGAGYNSRDGITVTVYVYPIETHGVTLAQFTKRMPFDGARAQIVTLQPTTKIIDERDVPPPRGANNAPGLFGRYEFTGPFGGGPARPMESLLYTFAPIEGRWIVKYRMTYPQDNLDARMNVARFVEAFTWNLRSGPPTAR